MRGIFHSCGLCLLALALSLSLAHAQNYPSKPIRMIVPYPPGGGMDVTARIVSEKLGDIFGQQIVIENRAGASGTIGAAVVARANPDGYTLLLTPSDPFTAPALLPKMDFDPNKDLLPVAMVSENPIVLVATAGAPFGDVKGMIAAAKANPNGLTYATPGSGSINHAIGAWIGLAAHIKLLEIPFNGGPQAATAIAAGDVSLGLISTPSFYPGLVDAGKIKVIALTARYRPSFVPASWPTLAAAGLPIDTTLWIGVFAPAGTPDAIVARLNRAISQALRDDQVRKRMNNIGFSPEFLGQAEFVKRIRADAASYDQIIRQTGIAIVR